MLIVNSALKCENNSTEQNKLVFWHSEEIKFQSVWLNKITPLAQVFSQTLVHNNIKNVRRRNKCY